MTAYQGATLTVDSRLLAGILKWRPLYFFSAAERIFTKCLDSWAFVAVLVRRLMWPRGHTAFRSATQDGKAAALPISPRLAAGGHITASIIVIGVMTILRFGMQFVPKEA